MVGIASQTVVALQKAGSLLPALRVCGNCKRRKKKCDKVAPACTQCRLLGIACVYKDPTDLNPAAELRSLRERLKRLENAMTTRAEVNTKTSSPASDSTNSGLCSIDWPSNHKPVDPFVIPAVPKAPNFPVSLFEQLDCSNICRTLNRGVFEIVSLEQEAVFAASHTYFETVHRWLPAISRDLYFDRLVAFMRKPEADFALLIMSVFLILQIPTDDANITASQQNLYRIVKQAYAGLHMHLPISVPLIQAGLLISLYEHGLGRCEAAFLTLGSCMRLARSLGLDQMRKLQDIPETKEWREGAEKRNLWWGLVIRDTFTNLEATATTYSPTTEVFDTYTLLPFEAHELDPPTKKDLSPTIGCHKGFSTLAKASAILRRVLEVNKKPFAQATIAELDLEVQGFLGQLLVASATTWGVYCEAYTMIIAALITLHWRACLPSEADTQVLHTPTLPNSLLALHAAARIVLDVSLTCMSHKIDIDLASLPPGYIFIIYKAALITSFLGENIDSKQWKEDVEAIRRSIWLYQHRWKIAGDYLKDVDKAIANVTDYKFAELGPINIYEN